MYPDFGYDASQDFDSRKIGEGVFGNLAANCIIYT
jgi:hypothetical protein